MASYSVFLAPAWNAWWCAYWSVRGGDYCLILDTGGGETGTAGESVRGDFLSVDRGTSKQTATE